jgi:osmotically-inducible protein OsmY
MLSKGLKVHHEDETVKKPPGNGLVFAIGAGAGLLIGAVAGLLLTPGRKTVLRKVNAAGNKARGIVVQMSRRLGLTHANYKRDLAVAERVRYHVSKIPDIADLTIACEDGRCTIRGSVPRYELIRSIEKEVRGVPGVLDVNNMLYTPARP